MEHALSILLGLVVTISLAGIVAAVLFNYAGSVDDPYHVISHVAVHRYSDDISVVKVTFTNGGSDTITGFEWEIPSCGDSCNYTDSTGKFMAHTTHVINDTFFGKNVTGIIRINYTFEDGTVIPHLQKIR